MLLQDFSLGCNYKAGTLDAPSGVFTDKLHSSKFIFLFLYSTVCTYFWVCAQASWTWNEKRQFSLNYQMLAPIWDSLWPYWINSTTVFLLCCPKSAIYWIYKKQYPICEHHVIPSDFKNSVQTADIKCYVSDVTACTHDCTADIWIKMEKKIHFWFSSVENALCSVFVLLHVHN